MMQVLYQTDIEFIRYFHIILFHGTQCLQSNHLAHELYVPGRDRLGEQLSLVTILSFRELCYQHFHFQIHLRI